MSIWSSANYSGTVSVTCNRRYIMKNKKYTIKTTCPQCGCSAVSHLSDEEIREKFGDVPNIDMECHECMVKYETPVKEACPEWDKDCKMKE
jgi:hypothetical protein